MKKTLILLAIVATVWSCNNNDSASNDKMTDNGAGTGTGPAASSSPENRPATTGTAATDANATTAATGGAADVSKNPDYQKGLALIGKSDCLGCHKVNEKLVGPAYAEVAAKYADNPNAVKMLAEKVIKGGSGNWGQVPMSPHPQISQEDAEAMVKYVLLTKQ